jgi:hypothetical protein
MPVLRETLTLAEFAERAIPGKFPRSGYSHTEPVDSWNPCSFAQALEFLQKGYKTDTVEFAEDIAELVRRLSPEFDLAPNYDPAENGLFFDVGRVLEGAPECWYDQPFDVRPELNLLIHASFYSGVDKEQVYNRGVVICTLINLLSRKFNLQVKICFGVQSHWGSYYLAEIEIPNNPLDLDLMNFLLTHAGSYRRLGFSYWESRLNDAQIVEKIRTRPIPDQHIPENTLYFSPVDRGEYADKEDAEERLTEILQGVLV